MAFLYSNPSSFPAHSRVNSKLLRWPMWSGYLVSALIPFWLHNPCPFHSSHTGSHCFKKARPPPCICCSFHLACFSPLSIHGWLPHLLQALCTFQLCSKTFPNHPIHNSNFPSSIPFCVLFYCFCIALSNIYTYFFSLPQGLEQCLAHVKWPYTVYWIMHGSMQSGMGQNCLAWPLLASIWSSSL